MSERTIAGLKCMQAAPLSVKVRMTESRIRDWVNEYGEDGVFVSFSGGKDSTVLLDIVRKNYPDIPAVFMDTGLEYPEVRAKVKATDNVTFLKPKMTFRETIQKYGYPLFGKEIAEVVQSARIYLHKLAQDTIIATDRQTDRQTDRRHSWQRSCVHRLLGIGRYAKDQSVGVGEENGQVENALPRVGFARSIRELLGKEESGDYP